MPKTTSSAPKTDRPALSKPRLERMHEVLSGYIDRKEMPGLVALVSHQDDVHVETLGTFSFNQSIPMQTDTIFRIASLAKPVTAVAAMIRGFPSSPIAGYSDLCRVHSMIPSRRTARSPSAIC